MSECDEASLPDGVHYAGNAERGRGHVFSFNAACNFIERNDLWCIIRGRAFPTDRASTRADPHGRPWHYRYSPYDIGYQLHRQNPVNGLPTVVSLLSAPCLCDRNRNHAAALVLSKRSIHVVQFSRCPSRPLQLPGPTQNAFGLTLPIATAWLMQGLRAIVDGELELRGVSDSRAGGDHHAAAPRTPLDPHDAAISRFRRLCQLLKRNNLPLPGTH
jgi:serine/threonine-protein phosphatase 2B catalytic subunit